MSLNLHPQWREAIDAFTAAYDAFSEVYIRLHPTRGDRELLSPKMWSISHVMKEWIEDNNCSLLRISEQAFESVHYDYLSFQSAYKIPMTGEEILTGRRRTSSASNWGQSESSASRSRINVKKRKKNEDPSYTESNKRLKSSNKSRSSSSSSSKPPTEPLPHIKTNAARKLRLASVYGYNAQNINSGGPQCTLRMRKIVRYLKKHDEPYEDAPWRPKKRHRKRQRSSSSSYSASETEQ
jgi:hypothetical protein